MTKTIMKLSNGSRQSLVFCSVGINKNLTKSDQYLSPRDLATYQHQPAENDDDDDDDNNN